eukprot:4856522-Amphidinium_carterae.1
MLGSRSLLNHHFPKRRFVQCLCPQMCLITVNNARGKFAAEDLTKASTASFTQAYIAGAKRCGQVVRPAQVVSILLGNALWRRVLCTSIVCPM